MSDNDFESFLETDKPSSVVGKFTPSRIDTANSSKYPYMNICRLEIDFDNGERMLGCGSLIDKRILVTCAHNVMQYFDGKETVSIGGSTATQMKIIPQGGFSDLEQTVSLETGKNCFYPSAWVNVIESSPNWYEDKFEDGSKFMSYNSNSRKYDFAFVVLDNPFDLTKFNDFFSLSPVDTIQNCSCCCAYQTKKGQKIFIDSRADGSNLLRDLELQDEPKNLVKVRFLDKSTVVHDFDTDGGASGCPLFTVDSQGKCIIVAIHTLGNDVARRNLARIVDSNVLRVLDHAKNAL